MEFLTGEALFQTHDNLEHLAMMQAVLGPIPDKLIRATQYVLLDFNCMYDDTLSPFHEIMEGSNKDC